MTSCLVSTILVLQNHGVMLRVAINNFLGKRRRMLSCNLICKGQLSQEEHGQWQTSLANTNNNFTNPANLLLHGAAHWIDAGIYYISTFPPPLSNLYFPRDSTVQWFFFSLLKSHCWFLILKTAYNNVAKRGDSEARKYKRSILASAVIRGWPTEYNFILVILTFHIEKLSISASEIKYWMLKMQRDAKFPFNHVGSPFKPNH